MSSQVAEVSTKYLAEAVKNAVPVGYKQTEVGVIPEDWSVSPLRDLLKEPPKYGINAPAVPLEGTLPVYIRITDISEDGYFKPSEKVGVRSPFSGLYKLADGDVVLARTGASVGKSYLYKEDDGVLVYAGFLIKVSPDKNKLEPRFLSQYLKTQRYWSWVTVHSMRSGQPGINGNEYGDLLIPFPKIQEQTAIANALSDVDALISELEKLIVKKQAIKTATMQQLLTGRARLPQFALREDGTPKGTKPSELGEIPEDWEVVAMGSLGSFGRGRVISHTEINRAVSKLYPVYSSQTSNEGVMGYIDTYDFEGEFVTWTTDGVNAGKVFYRNGRFNCTNVCGVISVSSCDANYIAIAMGAESRKYVSTNLANPKLMNGEAKQVLIKKPNEVAEQTAIATILSDMDAEIQALEQRLGKTRQIKQGMMQELLTGKTRLVQPSLTGVCHAD
ncbi:restriction endonuclease subunit S [Vibrio cholerae]|nr:restriction endonuclease subunit S [Vibrio cholerae]